MNYFLGMKKYPADQTKISTILNDLANTDEELISRIKSVYFDADTSRQIIHCIFNTIIQTYGGERSETLQNNYLSVVGKQNGTVSQGTHSTIVGHRDKEGKNPQITAKILKEIERISKDHQYDDPTVSDYEGIMNELSLWGAKFNENDRPAKAQEFKVRFFKTLYKDDNYVTTTEEATDQWEDEYINYMEDLKSEIRDWKSRQIIYTGAPGTGKTFSVRKCVEELAGGKDNERCKFIQFHPSYDYSDFVEGLRPVTIDQKPTFVRVDGVFKAFCRRAVDCYLRKMNLNIEELKDFLDKADKNDARFKEFQSIIRADENQYYFIVDEINRADIGKVFGELMFGLEMSYRGVTNRFPTQYANLDTYVKTDEGVFKRYKDTGNEDVFENGFFIPENVHIIGTMNDIDRSVETFDFALRRRFKWREVKANEIMSHVLYKILSEKTDNPDKDRLRSLVKELNKRAIDLNDMISTQGKEFGLNEAFHLGVSYFAGFNIETDGSPDEDSDYQDRYDTLWNESLRPIIAEYIRGRDPQKAEPFLENCENVFKGLKKKDVSS